MVMMRGRNVWTVPMINACRIQNGHIDYESDMQTLPVRDGTICRVFTSQAAFSQGRCQLIRPP